jgi:tRNA-modifying protein YgfZ
MSPAYCLLPQRACIEVRGADATAFLHGQLSRTIDTLDSRSAPLAAWLDARGRARALFRVLRRDDSWTLITEHDDAEHVVQKLRMFVLRAKVVIAMSDERCAALVAADPSWLTTSGGAAPPVDAAVQRDGLHWLNVGAGLWQAVGSANAIADFAPAIERGPASLAALAEIRLGIPAITRAVAERFVAQMLNLDRLGALSFDKGCYPGQEVVARVHNLGAVKRRMRRYAGASGSPPAAGAIVSGADGAVGELVRAAPAGAGIELLAVVDDAAAALPLSCDGIVLHEAPLPYTLAG